MVQEIGAQQAFPQCPRGSFELKFKMVWEAAVLPLNYARLFSNKFRHLRYL
jgi:hypothetical protein